MNDGPIMNGKALRMRPSNVPPPSVSGRDIAKACDAALVRRGLEKPKFNTWYDRKGDK